MLPSVGKESTCNAGDPGWIHVLGRSPGEGNGSPLHSFLPGKSHGQRSLAVHGAARVRRDLAAKPQ